eukprot:TRINITY_DN8171_c0_g1_i1.p1 TRINITY_DN8171_c0_g1~~TRINITY_DN8171_c0_g1_i1.p1  ORF type:complete len:197 (+),score=81.69 TRINITY_DN8171_c0_g1_i1:61-591(+)
MCIRDRDKVVSAEDTEIIKKSGILVIDCSWNKFEGLHLPTILNPRKLPYVIAVNPVNYGVPYKLTDAEAIAATLYITGFENEAETVLSKFKWGLNFLDMNRESLDLFKECKNSREVEKKEFEFLRAREEEARTKKNRYEMPPSSSEEEAEEEEEEEEEDEEEEPVEEKEDKANKEK